MENSNQIVYSNIDTVDPLYYSTGLSNYMPLDKWIETKAEVSSYVYRITSNLARIPVELSFIRNTHNFYILFDDCLEGYTVRLFDSLQNFIITHNLQDKFIFLSGNRDVEEEYTQWIKKNSVDKVFKVCYNSNWYYRVKQNVEDYNLALRPLNKQKWFMCLNNRLHTHRAITVTYMDYLNMLEHGKVSCLDKDYNNCMLAFAEELTENMHEILEYQATITEKKLPINIDTEDFLFGSRPYDFNSEIYDDTLINLVTETYYHEVFNDYSHMFFSEKIWKPIVMKQMFILIGPRYGLQYLKELGFKTFDKFVDESYDRLDSGKRVFAAIDALNSTMKKYTVEELNEKTKEIRLYNFNHFMSQQVQDALCKDMTKLICS